MSTNFVSDISPKKESLHNRIAFQFSFCTGRKTNKMYHRLLKDIRVLIYVSFKDQYSLRCFSIFSETLEETHVRFLGFQEKNISIKSLQCHIAVDFPFAENFLTEVAL